MTAILSVEQYRELTKKPRKYRNTPKRVGDHRFDSTAEADRYKDLLLLQQGGVIVGLTLQPRFRLEVNGVHICDYVGDFEYYERGARVIEDKKGCKTREYVLKRKLMLAVHGIEVRET